MVINFFFENFEFYDMCKNMVEPNSSQMTV